MKTFLHVSLIAWLMIAAGCSSSKYYKAKYQQENLAYYQAAENYTEYLAKHNRPAAMLRLADCYAKMHNYEKAEYWYSRAINSPHAGPEDQLGYANALKLNGKYVEAKQWYGKYLTECPHDAAAQAQMYSCDSFTAYTSNADEYQVSPLNINTAVNNFGMTAFEGGFVYCSEQAVTPNPKTNPWNGNSFLLLLYSHPMPDGKFATPVAFSQTLKSPYHTGPVAFSPDYQYVYFCRSNVKDGKLKKDGDKYNNIKIYSARRSGHEWVDIAELPFNSDRYSCGHPTLSADGNTLYFISDKPGGYGNTDIYSSTLQNGKWSEPQNLGAGVNTSGYEMFPYYHKEADGKACLYFSTDGLPGMGGLDLYCSVQEADGSWGRPTHLDAPLNSSRDDFGIAFNADGSTGYLSSSRDADIDRLYMFTRAPKFFVDGGVYNRKTKEPIPMASLEINNTTFNKKEVITVSNEGKFFIPVDANSDYAFHASKEKFGPGSGFASTIGRKTSETLHIRIELDPQEEPKEYTGQLPFASIYYDFDKSNIRNDARIELDKVLDRMTKDPNLKLEISTYADARGSNQYNIALTQRRANSAVNYLTARGVGKDRLNARWYGESRPVNGCVDGVKCTETQHQQNRRADFMPIGNNVNSTAKK